MSHEAKKEKSESPKTKHTMNYYVCFTWANVFVICHNHSQYLSSRVNFKPAL